jgi:hypothetical protein
VLLALPGRDLDQDLVVEAFGPGQHRPRHIDADIERELAHGAARRIGDRRQAFRQHRQRRSLDILHETAEEIVEQTDFIV